MAVCVFFFFQAEDGIRDLVRSRGLGDVYKRQVYAEATTVVPLIVNYAYLTGYWKNRKRYEWVKIFDGK